MMRRLSSIAVLLALSGLAFAVQADPAALQEVHKQPINITAIVMFLAFVLGTLGITYWAASKTKSMDDL